jgi:membrane protein YqaA with SNARE-associated domain
VIASLLSRIADALHLGVPSGLAPAGASFLFVAAVVAAALLLGRGEAILAGLRVPVGGNRAWLNAAGEQ